MKIRKLQLKNIGVFDDETIEFQSCPVKDKAEIHIFTGQNGSGKTTILQALVSAFAFEGGFRVNLRNSFEKRIRKSTPYSSLYQVEISFNEEKINDYTFTPKTKILEQPITSAPIIERNLPLTEFSQLFVSKDFVDVPLLFCPFAYSGYRRIKDEEIDLFNQTQENPLYQALDFVKDENSKFTINQWLGRSLSKRALALEDNSEDAKQFTKNVQNLEKIVADIIGYNINFKLKTDLSLVIVKDNQELDFDVLPDGLKSLISWIGDLLMRLDSLKWEKDTPLFEREIILFLDEIEVHLHPAWQRKVLPIVQKLFKNSQIFVSTHSPFVVNSVDDAWVYKLELENGKAKVEEVIKSEDGFSYSHVLSEIFDIEEEFGIGVQKDLAKFKELRNKILASKNGSAKIQKEFLQLAKSLAVQSEELQTIVQFELRQLNKRTGKKLMV